MEKPRGVRGFSINGVAQHGMMRKDSTHG